MTHLSGAGFYQDTLGKFSASLGQGRLVEGWLRTFQEPLEPTTWLCRDFTYRAPVRFSADALNVEDDDGKPTWQKSVREYRVRLSDTVIEQAEFVTKVRFQDIPIVLGSIHSEFSYCSVCSSYFTQHGLGSIPNRHLIESFQRLNLGWQYSEYDAHLGGWLPTGQLEFIPSDRPLFVLQGADIFLTADDRDAS